MPDSTPKRAWFNFSLLLGSLMLLVLSLEAIWSADIAMQHARYKAKALDNLLKEQAGIELNASQLVPVLNCSPQDASAAEYSLRRVSASGYAGLIEIYALFNETEDRQLVLAGFASHNETPGFIDRLNRSWFQSLVQELNQGNDIDAISGATISSQAVINALIYCFSEL